MQYDICLLLTWKAIPTHFIVEIKEIGIILSAVCLRIGQMLANVPEGKHSDK